MQVDAGLAAELEAVRRDHHVGEYDGSRKGESQSEDGAKHIDLRIPSRRAILALLCAPGHYRALTSANLGSWRGVANAKALPFGEAASAVTPGMS